MNKDQFKQISINALNEMQPHNLCRCDKCVKVIQDKLTMVYSVAIKKAREEERRFWCKALKDTFPEVDVYGIISESIKQEAIRQLGDV